MSYATDINPPNYYPNVDEDQRQALIDSIKNNALPGYDPNVAINAELARQKIAAGLTAPYTGNYPKAMATYVTPESTTFGNALTTTANNLSSAQSLYGARQTDIGRGLNQNSLMAADWLAKMNMGYETNSAIADRRSKGILNNIQNQATYNHINRVAQTQLDDLRVKAEAARQRGDTQGWMALLSEIGTLVGTIVSVL